MRKATHCSVECARKREAVRLFGAERLPNGECGDCGREVSEFAFLCQGCISRRSQQKRKRALVEAYGGKCACCGEADLVFLTVDHKYGNGAKERRQLKEQLGYVPQGQGFYQMLKKRGYPSDYQILCYNCNMAKRGLPECPHKNNPPKELR
jgi:hypothetical protein